MALGNNMRIDKTRKKTGSPANVEELLHTSSKKPQPEPEEDQKLVNYGNENIICQIESSGTGPESEAHIMLGGQLIINYLANILEPIRSAVGRHKSVRISLKDITELDLNCLQLLRAIQISCKKQDIPCEVKGELSGEQKALISNAGFLELFTNQSASSG